MQVELHKLPGEGKLLTKDGEGQAKLEKIIDAVTKTEALWTKRAQEVLDVTEGKVHDFLFALKTMLSLALEEEGRRPSSADVQVARDTIHTEKRANGALSESCKAMGTYAAGKVITALADQCAVENVEDDSAKLTFKATLNKFQGRVGTAFADFEQFAIAGNDGKPHNLHSFISALAAVRSMSRASGNASSARSESGDRKDYHLNCSTNQKRAGKGPFKPCPELRICLRRGTRIASNSRMAMLAKNIIW